MQIIGFCLHQIISCVFSADLGILTRSNYSDHRMGHSNQSPQPDEQSVLSVAIGNDSIASN